MTLPMNPCRRLWLLGLLAAATARAADTKPADKPSLVKRLLRITGLSLAPGQLRAAGGGAGSLWVVGTGVGEAARRWSVAGGYRSPVFTPDGRGLYALHGNELVRFDAPGREPVRLQALDKVLKLVGVSDGELVVLRADTRQPLAVLPLDGAAAQALPLDLAAEDVQRMLGQMRGEARATEAFVVGPRTQRREGTWGTVEWQDIVLQPRDGSPARNLSRSGGADCAQPALDARGEQVAYVLLDDV